MTVVVRNDPHILNKISGIIALVLMLLIFTWLFYVEIKDRRSNVEPYNFVDLQMRFKRYVLVNKYQKSEKEYIFHLVNPVTDDLYEIPVAYYLYTDVYFVGDTIR